MDGEGLIEALKRKLKLGTDAQVADYFGYTSAGINQIKQRKVSERTVSQLIAAAANRGVERAADEVQPLVEFFEVHKSDGGRSFLNLEEDDQVRLKKQLESCCGIYSFYNSEIEIIYVGKTIKNSLWNEMCSAYNREMLHYERYKVHHPRGRFHRPKHGSVRKIERKNVNLKDAAIYFSAYSVPVHLVSIFEIMLIRMVPNDLLNVRMEGNTSLKSYNSV